MNQKQTSSFLSYRFQEDITSNFDVSVVMPFYKKLEEFKKVFPRNQKYFQRNGIELIIILDCPEEKEELLDYIRQYPFINWKIIYNKTPHEWRNPAKPLNVGIRNATKKYVMVCSPESEFFTDAIFQLRKSLEYYPDHYAIGTVAFTDEGDLITSENINDLRIIPFGSILVERRHLERIEGYDEALDKWGGDDNNIRSRLEYIGIRQLLLPEVKLLHRDIGNFEGKERRSKSEKDFPTHASRHFFYPKTSTPNGENWGRDFNEIIYDWKEEKSERILKTYLEKYEHYTLMNIKTHKNYNILLLIQTYNESENILRFMDSMASKVDGMILLDDGSDDDTYEIASHDKLLLKVKHKRKRFDDLLNRNNLVELASFFNYEWACFIDVDEELDSRYNDFREIIAKHPEADSFLFNLIQLWDSPDSFNSTYPSTEHGIALRFRMFKNMGYAQMFSPKGKLHFVPIPWIGRVYHVPLLIKHYGNLTQKDRLDKYHFYTEEDKEGAQISYEHLLEKNPSLKNINDISETDLLNAIKLIKL